MLNGPAERACAPEAHNGDLLLPSLTKPLQPPPPTVNTTSPPPKLILDEDDHAAGLTGILVVLVATTFNMLFSL